MTSRPLAGEERGRPVSYGSTGSSPTSAAGTANAESIAARRAAVRQLTANLHAVTPRAAEMADELTPHADAGAPSDVSPLPSDGASSAPPRVSVDAEIDFLGFGRFQILALAVLGLANASDAVEIMALSFILPHLGEGADGNGGISSSAKATLSASIFVGMLVGGLVFGIAADALGRRKTLAFSLAVNAAFGLLSAVTPRFEFLLVARIVAGFGVGGSIPGVFTLAAEVLPSEGRGFWLSTVAWWWMVGSLAVAGAAWVILGALSLPWQLFAAVCAIPAATASALVFLLLPESPRYLHTSGDVAAAQEALCYIARWNRRDTRLAQGWQLEDAPARRDGGAGDADVGGGKTASDDAMGEDVPLVARSYQSSVGVEQGAEESARSLPGSVSDGAAGDAAVAVEPVDKTMAAARAAAAASAPAALDAAGLPLFGRRSGSPRSTARGVAGLCGPCACGRRGGACGSGLSWAAILGPLRAFFAPPHSRTSWLLVAVWFALSFGWYGLILWIPTLFHNANIDLDEYQDSFLVAAANLPGNIVSAVAMDRIGRKMVLALSLAAACASAAVFPFATTEVTVVLAACTLNAVSTCSWNALDCLSTESFPTSLRTTALGVLAASGRLGSIAGQFVFGSLIDQSVLAVLISASAVLGAGALAALALPREVINAKLHET